MRRDATDVHASFHLNVSFVAPRGRPRVLDDVRVGRDADDEDAVINVCTAPSVVVNAARIALEARLGEGGGGSDSCVSNNDRVTMCTMYSSL